MILATYQCLDYLSRKNKKYSKLKELLGVSQDTNLYWCIAANNVYQVVINSYTIEANQPALFVMFETNNFYKIDAIKWNYYVETQDESLLTKDLFNIEHEDAIEYIVTNIPDKRFEVNTIQCELINLLKNEDSKYSKSILKYQDAFLQAFKKYPTHKEIENMTILAPEGSMNKSILTLMKYFIMFKSFLLIPLYFAGLDYLGYTIPNICKFKINSIFETCNILRQHFCIYTNCNDIDVLYKKYKDFYDLVYNKIFLVEKIPPNAPCPCNSGLKYKKCCSRNNNFLYKQMIEGLS